MENGTNSPVGPVLHLNRLPTLWEVLSRRTLPPVDLFSFYIFMRDEQRAVDSLDFWLDVSQHMSLCRHYVRELRRSVLIGTPEGEKSQSKRSSQILEQIGDMEAPRAGPSGYISEKEKNTDAQMSAYLREEAANMNNGGGQSIGHSPSGSFGSSVGRNTTSQDRHRGPNSPQITTDSNSPGTELNRADLTTSAEKILYTYLLPSSEREINIPHAMVAKITSDIEEWHRDDPEVFDDAADWVFQAIQRDAFPKFLAQKALGNLVTASVTLRTIVGLLGMFGGFWTAFILIFLDFTRLNRLWIIIPFTVGVYFLMTQQYKLDPILGILGFSEYTLFHFVRIKEPYVRRLIIKRSLMVLAMIAAVDAALVVLFVFVPGKRL